MSALRKSWTRLIAVAAAVALLGAHEAAQADAAKPGEGKTIRYARSNSLGASYIQDEIVIAALEKLGYEVKMTTLVAPAFYAAASEGGMDLITSINWPQNQVPYEQVKDKLALINQGSIIGGGINGYLIDKKTAEAHNITNFEQLKDPKLAALFDTNGDGKADLNNCDPGWTADLRIQIDTAETCPVDQRQECGHPLLGLPHAHSEAVRVTVGPAHSTSGAARGQMSPLHPAEILVIKNFRQRNVVILEGMDRAMFAIHKWPIVQDLPKSASDDFSHRQRRGDGVPGEIDRSFLVNVDAGEVEIGVPENRFGKRHMGAPDQFGPEEGDRLGMAAAIEALFEAAHMLAEIMDEFTEPIGALFRLTWMYLIPQVPREEDAATAPALDSKGQSRLDRLPALLAEQNA